MKTYIQSLFLLLIFSLSNTLSAQFLENDPAEPAVIEEACWDETIQVRYSLSNTSTEDVSFLWKVSKVDVPEEWEYSIIDVLNEYNYEIESCPIDRPNMLDSGQIVTYTSLYVKTNNISGIGKFEWVFFNPDDETDVYLTVPIMVTALECTSATQSIEHIEKLSIYPNPTTDFFKVSNQDLVDRLSIYNIVGKEVKSMGKNSSGSYNVSDLTNGMYLVRLFDEDGDVLKVVRMSKR